LRLLWPKYPAGLRRCHHAATDITQYIDILGGPTHKRKYIMEIIEKIPSQNGF